MDLYHFFLILKARYKVILACFAVIVVGTFLVSLMWPKKYTATADILLDIKMVDPLSGAMSVSPMVMSFMATQIDIIKSQRVAIRAIKQLKINQNPIALQQWKDVTDGVGSFDAWLADRFGAALDVKPARESNVVSISYVAPDPNFCALMANAFAQAYVDTTLELRVEPARQSASWFDERTRTLRDQLEKAQARLSAYQLKHGIIASDERVDVETARLAELSTQLTSIQAQTMDAQSRQQQAKGDIETSPDIMQNPVTQSLRADLARQETKLDELSVQLGKNHPQYKRTFVETESLREKLNAEMKKVQLSMGAASEVSRKRQSEIHSALSAQKGKILDLKKQRDEISVLVHDVDSAQRSYDAVSQRLTQTNLESQLNQTNVVVLNPAVEPLAASSPKILRNLLIAVFLGTLIGVGIAFGVEMADQHVRGVDDLATGFDCPVIGVFGAETRKKRNWGSVLQKYFPRLFRIVRAQ